jgi:hypothetical protein
MRTSLISIFLLALLVPQMASAAEKPPAGWEKIKQADGIRVLSRSDAGEILKVRAITVVQASLERVKAVIDDAAHQPDWVPYLEETRVLQRDSDTEALLYSRFNAPWPARDRDFVYQSIVSRGTDGVVTYRLRSRQSDLMPPRDDYIRAELMEGEYRLVPLAPNRTRVEFMFHADPRGHLPLWIVNIVERSFPFDALAGLRRVVMRSAAK